MNMILKWQASLNSRDIVGAVLMDLSKTFDSLPHGFLMLGGHVVVLPMVLEQNL